MSDNWLELPTPFKLTTEPSYKMARKCACHSAPSAYDTSAMDFGTKNQMCTQPGAKQPPAPTL